MLCGAVMVAKNTQPQVAEHAEEKGSKYASRFPKPTKTLSKTKGAQADIDRDYCIKVVDAMVANPALGAQLYGFIKKKDGEAPNQDERWNPTYMTLDRLGKSWCGAWLLEMQAANTPKNSGKISEYMLNTLEKFSNQAIKMVFYFATATTESTYLPREALCKRVCARMLTARAALCGNRLPRIVQSVLPSGDIDWLRAGCYHITWGDEGFATEIQHCSGTTVAVPAHIRISSAFSLTDNHLDFSAKLSLAPAEYKLCDFFGKTGGPWPLALGKKAPELTRLAEQGAEALEAETKSLHVGIHQADVLSTVKEERQNQAMAKLRTKLAENRELHKRRRVISLSTT